jgi:hypothetical protein
MAGLSVASAPTVTFGASGAPLRCEGVRPTAAEHNIAEELMGCELQRASPWGAAGVMRLQGPVTLRAEDGMYGDALLLGTALSPPSPLPASGDMNGGGSHDHVSSADAEFEITVSLLAFVPKSASDLFYWLIAELGGLSIGSLWANITGIGPDPASPAPVEAGLWKPWGVLEGLFEGEITAHSPPRGVFIVTLSPYRSYQLRGGVTWVKQASRQCIGAPGYIARSSASCRGCALVIGLGTNKPICNGD